MQRPHRVQVYRQRHVDPLGQQGRLQLGGVHLGLAGGQRLVDPATGLTDQLTGVLALARFELSDGPVRQCQRGLLTGVVDAYLLEFGAGHGGGDGVQRRVDQAEHVPGIEWIGLAICVG